MLHRAAYRALGLTGWTYQAIECDEAHLPSLLAGCEASWAGLSLTMPLKRAVLPLLDHTDPLATKVGAANTVVFTEGRRHGHNTDVPGMIAALAAHGVTATSLPPGADLGGQGVGVVEQPEHGPFERHGQGEAGPACVAAGQQGRQVCLVALNGLVGPAGEAQRPVSGPVQDRRKRMRDR